MENNNLKIKNILITGGMGFIGSHFVDKCITLYKNAKIYIWDKMTYAGIDRKLPENCTLIKEDICNNKINETLKNIPFDFIVHFAAESAVGKSFNNKELFYTTNVLGTKNIIALYKDVYKLNNSCKFLHISTDEVYGEVQRGKKKETDKLDAKNPYAKTKQEADELVQKLIKQNYKVYITRSCNTYGSRQNKEKLIPCIIYNLQNDIPLSVFGTGKNIRQWVFVEDSVNAMIIILNSNNYGIYNIGTNDYHSVIKVMKTLTKIARKKQNLTYVKDWEQNDIRYSVDSKKLKKLGWKPKAKFYQELTNLYYKKRND